MISINIYYILETMFNEQTDGQNQWIQNNTFSWTMRQQQKIYIKKRQKCDVDECGSINTTKENICAAKTKTKQNLMEKFFMTHRRRK